MALMLTGAGCASESEPLVVPEVRWPQGEPSGELESDPWVQALREYEALFAAAWNAHDWSDPALLAVMSGDIVHRTASGQRDALDQGRYFTLVGPRPFEPLSVEETGPDKAEVVVCAYATWSLASGQVAPASPVAFERGYYLERDESGQVRVMTTYGTETECDVDSIKPGFFDPAPEPLDGLDGDDVREAEPERR
ncbi:hypothetical protein [Cellulosimicrobium sp. NPDC055967]|uniref:hypothetical protein n=1 Tax=Cellulosimicrobium sp. NPDC055967 TaxID=3345670 RepID=UPI0035E12604